MHPIKHHAAGPATSCRRRRLAVTGIVLAAIALCAGVASAQALDPYSVSSRSGAWTLAVDPSVPEGGGPCGYVMHHDGAPVWAARLPFTLWEAAVSDDGHALGVAYSRGLRGLWPPGGSELEDELVVVCLDAEGRALWEDRLSRTWVLHGLSRPYSRGCFLQPELDRFVVRLLDANRYEDGEQWRAYRVATGECSFDLHPRNLQSNPQALGTLLAARPVEGTSFVVAHWDAAVKSMTAESEPSERLALLDEELRPVWSFELPATQNDPEFFLRSARRRGESLAGEWGTGRFTLRVLHESRCIPFELERDAQEAVLVRELERVPCDANISEELAVLEAPVVELEELPSRSLGELDPDFCIVDSLGRSVVLDRTDARIHVFDATGRHLFASEPAPMVPNSPVPHVAALRDGSILVELGRGDHLHLAADGTLLGSPRFSGGRLVVRPGTDERWVVRDDEVVRLGADGEETLRLARGAHGRWLGWVHGIAVSPAGELAVLSGGYPDGDGPARVHLFDAEGRAIGALPAGRGITARLAHGGGWLALDLSSRRGLLIRRRDGACLRFDHSNDSLGRSFFSPDGLELWRFARGPLRLLRHSLPSANE